MPKTKQTPDSKKGGKRNPEYNSWRNAINRCHNEKHPRYAEWGGKGVRVCDRWLASFENFYADMGARLPGTNSLDRIDGMKGYEPGNCRWATPKVQSVNRPTWVNMISFEGVTRTMTDWATHIGIGRKTLYDRLRHGMSIQEALTTGKLNGRRFTSNSAV